MAWRLAYADNKIVVVKSDVIDEVRIFQKRGPYDVYDEFFNGKVELFSLLKRCYVEGVFEKSFPLRDKREIKCGGSELAKCVVDEASE